MTLSSRNPDLQLLRHLKSPAGGSSAPVVGAPFPQLNIGVGDPKERIKSLIEKAQLVSASAYDTAWVAMVPTPANKYYSQQQVPYFPGCVKWILENQQNDGSWANPAAPRDPLLMKDTLSCTLACVLALKRWGIGHQHIHDAIGFVERNSSCLTDSRQHTPIGFDIIFPSMIQTCTHDFNLNLHLENANIDAMIRAKDLALNSVRSSSSRSHGGRDAYLAYISEGLIGNPSHGYWDAMKFQRSNGSILNSPSATAAGFIRFQDRDCLRHLRSLVGDNPKDTTAAIYPPGIHARLSLIDAVESLGVRRHFEEEMKSALEEIHRCWQREDEEIFLDPTTCAMAFRLLRLNGYHVSADVFESFREDSFWNETMEGYLRDDKAVLELHKASQVIYSGESILDHQQKWTRLYLSHLLQQQESTTAAAGYDDESDDGTSHPLRKSILTVVHNALNCPFRVDLDHSAHKRNIEHFCTDNTTRVLKSAISYSNSGCELEDLQNLALEDFTNLQSSYQHELHHLMMWLEEKGLAELRLAKVRTKYCYFSAAATFSDPELVDARMLFTKHAMFVSLVDDLYDMFGTPEEHLNFLHLFERWDPNGPKVEFASERVETLYWALHGTIIENAEKAAAIQGRNVMDHVVELWVAMLRGMHKEAEWARSSHLPTLEEYMSNASITIGVGAFLVPSLYLAGHKLSQDLVQGPKFQSLLAVTSTSSRLLNDCRGFEREAEQGKMNAVVLRMNEMMISKGIGEGGDVEAINNYYQQAAIEKADSLTEDLTRQVLESALIDEKNCNNSGDQIPKEIRGTFWKLVRVLNLFYRKEDLFHASTKLVQVVDALINHPVSL